MMEDTRLHDYWLDNGELDNFDHMQGQRHRPWRGPTVCLLWLAVFGALLGSSLWHHRSGVRGAEAVAALRLIPRHAPPPAAPALSSRAPQEPGLRGAPGAAGGAGGRAASAGGGRGGGRRGAAAPLPDADDLGFALGSVSNLLTAFLLALLLVPVGRLVAKMVASSAVRGTQDEVLYGVGVPGAPGNPSSPVYGY